MGGLSGRRCPLTCDACWVGRYFTFFLPRSEPVYMSGCHGGEQLSCSYSEKYDDTRLFDRKRVEIVAKHFFSKVCISCRCKALLKDVYSVCIPRPSDRRRKRRQSLPVSTDTQSIFVQRFMRRGFDKAATILETPSSLLH